MAISIEEKLSKLVEMAAISTNEPPPPTERGVVIVYPPDQELDFRQHIRLCIQSLQARSLPHAVIDVERLPFEHLESVGRLEDAYRIELEEPTDLRKYLAAALPTVLKSTLIRIASELPVGAYIVLANPASLFPWVKYADVLSELPVGFRCHIVIPFPGHEEGAYLHFLDHRDGYNYLARRID